MIIKIYEDESRFQSGDKEYPITVINGRHLVAAYELSSFQMESGSHSLGWENICIYNITGEMVDIEPKENGFCKIASDAGVTVAQYMSKRRDGRYRWVEMDS